MSEVARNIRRLRARQGLTQEGLAERLHVTRQAVSNWETGKNQPDLDMLEAIASALETEPGKLFGPGEQTYPRYSRKAVLWVTVLGGLTLLLLTDRLFIVPCLQAARARTFNVLPVMINELALLPLCRIPAGMLLPALISLRRSVRPAGKLRLLLRLLPFLLLLPLVLLWLGLLWSRAYGAAMYLLTDPGGIRQELVLRLLPFFAGLCLYPAYLG